MLTMMPDDQYSYGIIANNPIENRERKSMNKTPSNFPLYFMVTIWGSSDSIN